MSTRYHVLHDEEYNRSRHRADTVSHAGKCGLHGCGEAAVLSMEVLHGDGAMWLGVCARGVGEYASQLNSRHP